MWIYKIQNSVNGKVYIGQTSNSVKKRFRRHINDAMSNKLDTHFARAIRKYGEDNFTCDVIDSADSEKELTIKEHLWIEYYNSIENGYNETYADFRSGGNTYASKTLEELDEIRRKISASKMSGNNPHARRIKQTNISTGEVLYFDSIVDCARYHGIKSGKTSIEERLRGRRETPYKNSFVFEYANE